MKMQGLHLTGDLFQCGCAAALLTDLQSLSTLCREATLAAGLTIVSEKFHVFPDWHGQPGGVTGALLLAESHLALHTWPERQGVTLDVYVCNFSEDNAGKAEHLFNALLRSFQPTHQTINRILRGDLSVEPKLRVPVTVNQGVKHGHAAALDGRLPLKHEDPASNRPSARDSLVIDWLNSNAGYGFTASQHLATIESPYQRIEVFQTPQFGKVFRLDGRFMTSEKDEFFYHECMTHPALLAHPEPKSVLIIGGGDGGSSEEVFKHPSVQRVVMAELDGAVIAMAREHFGAIHHNVFDDPRLEIHIGDGYNFVATSRERFDLIVLDLTDPDTPAFHLYTEAFFALCRRILNPGGLLTLHLGSPVYQPETVSRNARNLRKVFRHVCPLSVFVPLYGSLWCLSVASDDTDPRQLSSQLITQRLRERAISGLSYYNAEVHGALFCLPNFVKDLVHAPVSHPADCLAGDTETGKKTLAAVSTPGDVPHHLAV